MKYKEKLLGDGADRGLSIHEYGQTIDKESEKSLEEHERIPHSKFKSYIPLNTSLKKMLKEFVNTEFKEARIRNPYPIREFSQTDRSKYYRFHKSHDHNKN